uniref:NADH dehydrogenase subunit 6 n=1 Tax=Parabreviscolex niepini TaxID=2041585 RepID=A0A3G2QVM9_9CEST|nr:NADH dehydrogenase subunit 6 [Parabreviscolex niepini]AYO27344.1 NADH dehydrogenase subunit 6 [Parabreviscolex niepini]
MSILVSGAFLSYFLCTGLFLTSTHCIFYCLLLVASCILSSLVVYLVLGFSWYSLFLCLVYVGGVYILFVFVSVQSPNTTNPLVISRVSVWSIAAGVVFLYSAVLPQISGCVEASSMLCTSTEGSFYICLCLTLLFGFVVISMVLSVKPSFYR